MSGADIFPPGVHVELIEGEVVEIGPVGGPHVWCVADLDELFNGLIRRRAKVIIQSPIRLGEFDEPEPDVTPVRRREQKTRSLPTAGEVFLIVEVSDSTLHHDRTVKLPRYAAAHIPEGWIVDLRAPTPAAFPDFAIAVGRLLPREGDTPA